MENNQELFSFTDQGFCIHLPDEKKEVKWKNIETLIAFKEDKITFELIFLDIFCDDGYSIRISEEVKGWEEFNTACKKNIPEISKNWEDIIVLKHFVTNATIVYDREQRDMKALSQIHYKD